MDANLPSRASDHEVWTVKADPRRSATLSTSQQSVFGAGKYAGAERLLPALSALDLDRDGSYSAHPSEDGGFLPLLEIGTTAPSKKAAAGIGTGTSVPALAILGLLALIAPRRSWRLRLRHEAPVATSLVLLLDHPG
jgi:hypothetical protein